MKTPPERSLSVVWRCRQRLSFIRLRAYLRTREYFLNYCNAHTLLLFLMSQ